MTSMEKIFFRNLFTCDFLTLEWIYSILAYIVNKSDLKEKEFVWEDFGIILYSWNHSLDLGHKRESISS